MISIKSRIPDNAATAGFLGTEREGAGVRIQSNGLILTVSYLVLEATEIWLTNHRGQTTPGHIVAHDFESGLCLLLPSTPIGHEYLTMATTKEVSRGDELTIYNNTSGPPLPCRILSTAEFVGRWEYLIDHALYTLPACDDWGGAALVTGNNELLGIGSLFLEFPSADQSKLFGNMFVPVELIAEHVHDIYSAGRRHSPPRPWLGAFIDADDEGLVISGLYPAGPAATAGLEPGDRILTIAASPIQTTSGFLRTLWGLGDAGVEVPLWVERDGQRIEIVVNSADRCDYFQPFRSGGLN